MWFWRFSLLVSFVYLRRSWKKSCRGCTMWKIQTRSLFSSSGPILEEANLLVLVWSMILLRMQRNTNQNTGSSGYFLIFACLICLCVGTGHVLGVVVVFFVLCSSLFSIKMDHHHSPELQSGEHWTLSQPSSFCNFSFLFLYWCWCWNSFFLFFEPATPTMTQ